MNVVIKCADSVYIKWDQEDSGQCTYIQRVLETGDFVDMKEQLGILSPHTERLQGMLTTHAQWDY